MGIKKRIMTSGRKFIDKHLALYNKLARAADFNDDGDESDDDKTQLFAKINAMVLTDNADGTFTATLTCLLYTSPSPRDRG